MGWSPLRATGNSIQNTKLMAHNFELAVSYPRHRDSRRDEHGKQVLAEKLLTPCCDKAYNTIERGPSWAAYPGTHTHALSLSPLLSAKLELALYRRAGSTALSKNGLAE